MSHAGQGLVSVGGGSIVFANTTSCFAESMGRSIKHSMHAPSERETLYEHEERESSLARDGKAESWTDPSVATEMESGRCGL